MCVLCRCTRDGWIQYEGGSTSSLVLVSGMVVGWNHSVVKL